MPITHPEYTSLLSATINHTITPVQVRKVEEYEAAAPKKCPHCGDRVWTMFEPLRVSHDVENCPKKK
jgi:hypothetical protein